MSLTLSIITPSYNQGEFIERTIQSVLTQETQPIEYHVFDGGSTDNTITILKKYEHKLSWVSEKDKGQTDAVNKGLKIAQGDIIGWLNSDDIYYPKAFERVIQYFTEHPEIDIIYGKANHIDKEDNILEPYCTEPWNFERLQSVCFISQPAVFFRKKAVDQYGLLNDSLRYCMDYEYWLRLSIKGAKFAHLPLTLAGSRLYMETKTLGQRVAVHAEINTMLKKTLGQTPDRWLSNYAHVLLDSYGLSIKQKRLFLMFLIMTVTYASLRWNKGISSSLRTTLKSWVKNIIKLS